VTSLIDLQFEIDVFEASFAGPNRDGFVQQLLFHAGGCVLRLLMSWATTVQANAKTRNTEIVPLYFS
jgi:hypothetical protein